VRNSDGRLLLREVAQTPDEDAEAFQDIDRHQYFNTNSLWLRLDLLKEQLAADSGVLPLPMIRNNKTVDPRDKKSTPVVQLEIAMGAAIECFEGSAAIDVPRSRFAPVKTTGDLLALRSDAYEVLENGQVRLAASRQGVPPVVALSDEYKLVDQIEDLGVPGLIDCDSLSVKGPLTFAPGVVVRGVVSFENTASEPRTVAAGVYENQAVKW
jgi:UDP-N-acetylglucosamine pyrophosphorylase